MVTDRVHIRLRKKEGNYLDQKVLNNYEENSYDRTETAFVAG